MSEEQLSRRERQIMRAIYRHEKATVQEVREALADPPSLNAVRTLIQILEKKGHLRREKRGREFVYSPRKSRVASGVSELQQVLETFFEDSIEQALATHLTKRRKKISPEEYEHLSALIEAARKRDEEKEN